MPSISARAALAVLLAPALAGAQSSMTLLEYPGRWVGNKAAICEGGTLVELPVRTTADFSYVRDPDGTVTLGGSAHWQSAPVTVKLPVGTYFETAYLWGVLQGASKRMALNVRARVTTGDIGHATFGSKNMIPSGSSGLYRVMDAQATYVNATDHEVSAIVVVGAFEEDWGAPVDSSGNVALGTVLKDYTRPFAEVSATGQVGDVNITAIATGAAGNAIQIVYTSDSTSGVTINVSGRVITVHYKKGVSTIADVATALGALTGADKLVTVDLGSQDPTVVLSDVLRDPATLTLRGGADAVPALNGDMKAGVCLRSITQPTDDEEDRKTCQALIDAAGTGYAPASVSTTVTDLGTRVTTLEKKPAPTCECGLERTGGGITSGCAASGADAASILALAGLAGVVRLARRRRASP